MKQPEFLTNIIVQFKEATTLISTYFRLQIHTKHRIPTYKWHIEPSQRILILRHTMNLQIPAIPHYSNSDESDESDVSDVYNEDSDEPFGFLEEKLPAVTMPQQRSISQSSQSSQLSPSVTASASSPSTPLLSPATRLATVSLGQIQINSPNPTSESDTDMASVTHQQHFVFPTPKSKGKRPASQTPTTQRQPKRLQYQYNPTSGANKPAITVTHIGELNPDMDNLILLPTRREFSQTINPTTPLPSYYPNNYKDWNQRPFFTPHSIQTSTTGLPRTDLYVYRIEANAETSAQRSKTTHKRNMRALNTPIERFCPHLWDEEHARLYNSPVLTEQQLGAFPFYGEPYENALSVIRTPQAHFQKVSPAIPEPQTPLHCNPPPQQHSLSEQGARLLLNSTEPIEFFDAIYSSREMTDLIQQTNLYRQQHPDLCKYAETTYEEMRCFIGLLLWTSLVVLPNRRAYFATSEVYNLPDFKIHMTRDRFEQLFRMLHCADNKQLPADLGKAKRFEAKLGRQLTGVNTNSAQLLQPVEVCLWTK